MYSLTFCVRSRYDARTPPVETRSAGRRSNVENAPHRRPVTGKPAMPTSDIRCEILRTPPPSLASQRPASCADPAQPAVCTMSSYRGLDASLKLGFALCCHSNAASAPIANPPNSAQLGGSLYHAPKLHPDPCSIVGVRPRTLTHTDTHRQTDTPTRVTTIHFASSTTYAKCNDRISFSKITQFLQARCSS